MSLSNTKLEDHFVRSCADISNPEEYRQFFEKLNNNCNPEDLDFHSESSFDTLTHENALGQARVLLCRANALKLSLK